MTRAVAFYGKDMEDLSYMINKFLEESGSKLVGTSVILVAGSITPFHCIAVVEYPKPRQQKKHLVE